MKLQIRKKQRKNKKESKTRPLTAYILCKNKQIKEYSANVTRKFNLNDETYVVKGKCCYIKKINGQWRQFSLYIEGNPNPFNLNKIEENEGLTNKELDSYIAGDLFNILIECQMMDKRRYVIALTTFSFIICFCWCLMELVF